MGKAEGEVAMEFMIEEFGGMAVTLLYTAVIVGAFARMSDVLILAI